MKLRNIYKMSMTLSLMFGISPLFLLVIVNIFGYVGDCGFILSIDSVSHCYDSGFLYSLFLLSVYWVITLPIGIVLWLSFYLMYVTAKK